MGRGKRPMVMWMLNQVNPSKFDALVDILTEASKHLAIANPV